MEEPKIGIRQRLKNIYVEARFGFKYFNFPWKWDSFFYAVTSFAIVFASIIYALKAWMQWRHSLIPLGDTRRPLKRNDSWNQVDNRNDILGVLGIRGK